MTQRTPYYVLAVLLLGYVFNYLDRYVLTILLPAIKADLHLSDGMLGFLVGPAFAFVYALAGVPVARFADRRSRTGVLAAGMTLWSLFTAASGLVQSAFQLACARVAVGVGEAAGTAPSHALISSYFAPEQRGRALAIFGSGIYIGMFLGLFLGGTLVEQIGWRWTFAAVGLPGIAVALLIRLTIDEPALPAHEGAESGGGSTWEGVRQLWSLRAFRYSALGLGVSSFGGAGFGFWVPTFLQRVHGMSPSEVGASFGFISPVAAALATVGGGFLCDRLISRDPRWWAWLPALSTLIATPFLTLVVLWPLAHEAVWWALPAGIGAMASPAVYAVVQNLAPAHLRALATSVLILNTTLIGMGAGPWAVGYASDLFSDSLGVEALRYALVAGLITNPIGALFFWRAARSLREDLAQTRGAARPTPTA
jgi:MFS family permease